MKSKRIVLAVVGVAALFLLVGCVAEQGVQDGVQNGVASAIAALIEVPVNAWLDGAFAG